MPAGDRTGPMGEGPMTGRKAGLCTGNETPGFNSSSGQGGGRGSWFRRGPGRGPGMRRGWGRGWGQEFTDESRGNSEVSEVESLKKSLKEIEKRLKNLEK